jgi:hypothetical protein
MEKLIPYSLYLPQEQINQLKEKAKDRRASAFIRDAVIMALEGNDKFNSGYNKGLRDAIKIIGVHKQANAIAVDGVVIADSLVDQIKQLEA